jgi:hypothetical protein
MTADDAGPLPEQPRVDPGALALATVAGAVAFIFGGGDWDVLAVVIGLMLLMILLAHHHAAPARRTPRAFFLRAAFGATTGLAFCIAVAPAIQFGIVTPYFHTEDEEGFSDDAWNTTLLMAALWIVVAVLLAVLEPRIARWLDRTRE